MDQPHRSASRNARNFRSVSSTSASGRLPATIPAPAYSVAWSPRSSAHRSAIAHSPSPLASIHPTGPAYDPRSNGSSSAISLQRRVTRFPRDGRCRMEGLDELEHARRWISEEPPELRRQVPHVRRLQQGRDGIPRELSTEGGELRGEGIDDDRVLLVILRRREESSGVLAILIGVARTRRGTGQGVRTHDAAEAGHEQLRGRADDDPGRRRRERVRVRVHCPEPVRETAGIESSAGIHLHRSGEHDLAQLAGTDPIHRLGDPATIVGCARRVAELLPGECVMDDGLHHPLEGRKSLGSNRVVPHADLDRFTRRGPSDGAFAEKQVASPRSIERKRPDRDRTARTAEFLVDPGEPSVQLARGVRGEGCRHGDIGDAHRDAQTRPLEEGSAFTVICSEEIERVAEVLDPSGDPREAFR